MTQPKIDPLRIAKGVGEIVNDLHGKTAKAQATQPPPTRKPRSGMTVSEKTQFIKVYGSAAYLALPEK